MAKYEKHETDEGKFQCTISDYGHGVGNGKSRQAVTKHYNRLQSEKPPTLPNIPVEEETTTIGVDVIEDIKEDETPDTPDWLTFDMSGEDGEQPTISINPTASTILKGMAAGHEPPKSAKAMREYYAQQGKMLRWVFAGVVDPLFTWYGRSITADPKFEIKRTQKDWTLFEEVSANWLEYHQWNLPITPDIIMMGTVASFYAPVIMKVNSRRSPNKPSLFKRWLTRRKMRRAIKEEKAANTWKNLN